MNWFTNLPTFDLLYISLITIGLITSTIFNRYLVDGLKLLPLLSLVYLLLEVISAYTAAYVDNNHFIYHIFSPIDYTIYCLIFYPVLTHTSWHKFILYSIPAFCALSTLLSYIDGLEHTSAKHFLLRGSIITFYVLTYFRFIIKNQYGTYKIPKMFWFSTSVLFFFIGKSFIAGFMDILINIDLGKARSLYYFGYIFNYILFIMIIIISLPSNIYKK